MPNEAQPKEIETETPKAKSLSDPNISFAEYESLRRSENVAEDASKESAPAENAEQKESSDSDTEETEEQPDSDESQTEDESEDESKVEDQAKDKPKKKGGWQKRINKKTREAAEAKREAEYWKRVALESAGAPKKEIETPQADAADETKEPNPDDFDSHAEYVKAVAKWAAKEERKAILAEQEKSRLKEDSEQKFKAHYARETEFAKKMPDYAEVLEGVDHFKDASPTISQVIIESENGPQLMYELAKDPEQYRRINALPPIAAARELGRVEAKLAKSSESKPETTKLTKAPRPIEPVGGTKGTVSKSIFDKGISFEEYERIRREEMRRKSG